MREGLVRLGIVVLLLGIPATPVLAAPALSGDGGGDPVPGEASGPPEAVCDLVADPAFDAPPHRDCAAEGPGGPSAPSTVPPQPADPTPASGGDLDPPADAGPGSADPPANPPDLVCDVIADPAHVAPPHEDCPDGQSADDPVPEPGDQADPPTGGSPSPGAEAPGPPEDVNPVEPGEVAPVDGPAPPPPDTDPGEAGPPPDAPAVDGPAPPPSDTDPGASGPPPDIPAVDGPAPPPSHADPGAAGPPPEVPPETPAPAAELPAPAQQTRPDDHPGPPPEVCEVVPDAATGAVPLADCAADPPGVTEPPGPWEPTPAAPDPPQATCDVVAVPAAGAGPHAACPADPAPGSGNPTDDPGIEPDPPATPGMVTPPAAVDRSVEVDLPEPAAAPIEISPVAWPHSLGGPPGPVPGMDPSVPAPDLPTTPQSPHVVVDRLFTLGLDWSPSPPPRFTPHRVIAPVIAVASDGARRLAVPAAALGGLAGVASLLRLDRPRFPGLVTALWRWLSSRWP